MKVTTKKLMEFNQFQKTECRCKYCIGICSNVPGWFRPEEIVPLCEFLKMDLEAVFKKYLILDYWIRNEENIYILSPVKNLDRVKNLQVELLKMVREHNHVMGRDFFDRPGSNASWSYAFIKADCIFLKNDECMIYPVRPFECAVSDHFFKDPLNRVKISQLRELIAEEWSKSSIIKNLLEKKRNEVSNESHCQKNTLRAGLIPLS